MKSTKLIVLLIPLLSACTGYQVKDNKVYWKYWNEGSGRGEKIVPQADADSFVSLEHDSYGKDNLQGYYQGNPIKGIDSKSFKSIYRYYAVDKHRAYLGSDVIKGADGATFSVLEGNWGKDSKDYFFKTKPLDVCDYGSFEIHDFDGQYANHYAVDKTCAYFGSNKIPIKDKDSFNIIIAGYSKDKHFVYFEASVLEGADAASFAMVSGTFVGKDKNQCYLFGKPQQCNP